MYYIVCFRRGLLQVNLNMRIIIGLMGSLICEHVLDNAFLILPVGPRATFLLQLGLLY